jgi:hypothetical protein
MSRQLVGWDEPKWPTSPEHHARMARIHVHRLFVTVMAVCSSYTHVSSKYHLTLHHSLIGSRKSPKVSISDLWIILNIFLTVTSHVCPILSIVNLLQSSSSPATTALYLFMFFGHRPVILLLLLVTPTHACIWDRQKSAVTYAVWLCCVHLNFNKIIWLGDVYGLLLGIGIMPLWPKLNWKAAVFL